MLLNMRLSPKQLEALNLIREGDYYPSFEKEDGRWYARWKSSRADNPWLDEYVRGAAMTPLTEDAENQRHETLHDAWMMALKSMTGLVVWDDKECEEFAKVVREWNGGAKEDVKSRAAICFSLVPPKDSGGNFVLRVNRPHGEREYKALGQASCVFRALTLLRAVKGERYLEMKLEKSDVDSFVRSIAYDLEKLGYGVDGIGEQAQVVASAEIESGQGMKPEAKKAAKFKLGIKINGEDVDIEELRFLLEQKSDFVFFREHWIKIDRVKLKEALKALEKKREGWVSAAEAIGFVLGVGYVGGLEVVNGAAHGWVRGLVNTLRDRGEKDLLCEIREEKLGIVGKLTEYQKRGVAWMRFLTEHGFGALLADDMGLGKTIETIAWMLTEKKSRAETSPHLIVAPLTLLSNWSHELKKFAPSLKFYVHQGSGRELFYGFSRRAKSVDVIITSFQMLVKDYQLFRAVPWHSLIVDEAQIVKNPDTQAAKAIKALSPKKRIALTGTPVENTVFDVWALELFLNEGLLPERKVFEDKFVKPLNLDERSRAGEKLRHALEPFILRRLKTDPMIMSELGEKREIKEYCPLTLAQRGEYEAALMDYRATARTKGDVFALITSLKLICDGMGKLNRLIELLTEIFSRGESALVFTQYAKVGAFLQSELSKRFMRKFPFLHGSLSAKERDDEIRRFNENENCFILSLKAGGFGLNLTKATHVIHYDRWWNPATENQATDRAHRIGQKSTVFVHLFITPGTLEERVDEILERKNRMAGMLVKNGESFLASLSDNMLMETVKLGDEL